MFVWLWDVLGLEAFDAAEVSIMLTGAGGGMVVFRSNIFKGPSDSLSKDLVRNW